MPIYHLWRTPAPNSAANAACAGSSGERGWHSMTVEVPKSKANGDSFEQVCLLESCGCAS